MKSAYGFCIRCRCRSTDTDVGLAEAIERAIIALTSVANASAPCLGEPKRGVEIRYYSVIYDMIDDVKAASERPAEQRDSREHFIGLSSIQRSCSKVTGVGKVAGLS